MNKFHFGALGCFLLTLFLALLYFSAKRTMADTAPKGEKINLSLRQMAHRLYKLSDDHRSTIPPVKQRTPNSYQLKLNRAIEYDHLPYLLDEALASFNIDDDYTVAIKSCTSGQILLGYNLSAFENKEITCVGRELASECNILEVTFETQNNSLAEAYLIFAIGSLMISLFFAASALRKNSSITDKRAPVENEVIQIGHFTFAPDKLILEIDQQHKALTFREAKLLRYMATHANEILKREDIQQHVWQEEGVIVGRSLDVFISRLRKALKPDPSVAIKNIHGVGYRLEVKEKG